MYAKKLFEFIIKKFKDVPPFFGTLPQWGSVVVGVATVRANKKESPNAAQPLTPEDADRDHQNEVASEHPRRAVAEPEYGASQGMQKAFSVEETSPF